MRCPANDIMGSLLLTDVWDCLTAEKGPFEIVATSTIPVGTEILLDYGSSFMISILPEQHPDVVHQVWIFWVLVLWLKEEYL